MTCETVLVVDNNKFARTVVRAIINSTFPNIQVIEAENGIDAINKSKTNTFDWMIIDYDMPGMNGFDLIHQLKLNYPDAIISILSMGHEEAICSKAKSLGINYLSKPIEEHSIVSLFDRN